MNHGNHGTHAPIHGMVIVGEETIFLSHLPMFTDPHHRFQVILEATFKNGDDPQLVYATDRAATKTRRYTLRPEPDTLPDLRKLVANQRAFKGAVVRGHFELPAAHELIPTVTVEVKHVVHFRELDPQAPQPPHLEYLLFGKGSEIFLEHFITSPPDFGQIVAVRVIGHELTDDELSRGMPVVIPERENHMHQRLKEGQRTPGQIRLSGEPAPEMLDLQFEVERELHFEDGDLRSQPTFEPTPEEIAAGFGEQ